MMSCGAEKLPAGKVGFFCRDGLRQPCRCGSGKDRNETHNFNEIGNATLLHRSPASSQGRASQIVCKDILYALKLILIHCNRQVRVLSEDESLHDAEVQLM